MQEGGDRRQVPRDERRAWIERIEVENESRRADIRLREKRQESELETERWDRRDRRVQRYVVLFVFLLAAVAAIVLTFITPDAGGFALWPVPSTPVAVAVLAGLQLRGLNGSGRASSRIG